MMKVLGRWMPTLGLAACLTTAACKKEEATPTPPPPAEPSAPAKPTPPPPAAQPTGAGPVTDTDAGTSAGATPPPSTPPGSQAAQAEDPKSHEWTAGLMEVKRSGFAPVTMREVRTARNEGFDRLVLQFDGDQLPGYHIEYVDKPVAKCGSGDPSEVAGQGWLQVTVQPAQAHDGPQVTVAERKRKPGLPIFEEMELTCDFEGEVTWALGVKKPNKYRVMELSNPTRLVVDVQH
ncbi:AMIN-like domain-containing (lipo)protein [Archangium violaceum]|uniref:AMIN-like domain-containing (lipo)protein n=1 Tax=Archangium violaceum TaxID=83451 RepID=UPI0036D8ABD8